MFRRVLLLLLILMLGAAGCGSKENKEPDEVIIEIGEDGAWNGYRYVLNEYKFGFDRPESWVSLRPEEIEELFGEESSDYYKMIVVNNTQKIIISMFFENSNDMEQEAYLESIRKAMQKEKITYEFEDITTDIVGDMEFARMKSNITGGAEEGALSDQIYLAHRQGDRMLCIIIKYDAEYAEVVESTIEEKFVFVNYLENEE